MYFIYQASITFGHPNCHAGFRQGPPEAFTNTKPQKIDKKVK